MNDNIYRGETLSFAELLEKNNIEIPIIQRDYAQGRKENDAILAVFLAALKDRIVSESGIKLDFVYGNMEDDIFQPLDGQQRLTTLFLIHWYAMVKESIQDEEIKNLLLKFSYETRVSSREFCCDLIKNNIELPACGKKISDIIVDSNWFFLSWNQDPTISSMLKTIDDIHKEFYNIDNLWKRLVEMKLITFHYLILKDFGLSDDLYIKMNARGRLLTPFENFKAELQKLITDNEWEMGEKPIDTFAFKIDTIWTDFFWNNFRYNNSIDNAHMRFITTIVMLMIALNKADLKGEDRSQVLQRLNEDNSDKRLINYITKDVYYYLYRCYELYSNNNLEHIKLDFPMWRHAPKKSILDEIVCGDSWGSSYTHKVLFFAQTEYLLRNDDVEVERFEEWMRVVRNIVSQGDIDKNGKRPDIIRSPATLYGVINLISELAEGCSDIYNFLNKHDLRSAFAKDQIEEEKRKAKLFEVRPELKRWIWQTEDNDLLRGRISFILYCIDYDDRPDQFNDELLLKVQKVFTDYFSKESDLCSEFRRAMFTIEVGGKYEFYNYWWSRWNVANATKRKIFAQFRELEYYMHSEFKDYFKMLILKLIDNSYEDILAIFEPPEDMPNWKVRLIKETDLMELHCTSNYIAIPEDESCCYLLKSQRPRDIDDGMMIN